MAARSEGSSPRAWRSAPSAAPANQNRYFGYSARRRLRQGQREPYRRCTRSPAGIRRPRWLEAASLRAISDRHLAAGGFDRFLGELHVRDLIDRGLLGRIDVAIRDAVLDRPLGARRIEAGVDRPHAVLGLDVDRKLDGVLRL